MKAKWTVMLLLTGLLWPGHMHAQRDGLGSWNILHVRYVGGERWNAFVEAQLRSLRFYDDFHYHEVKGALEWRTRQGPRLALGAGKYDTYREGGDFVRPKNSDEVRVWPQLILVQQVGRFKVEQRYRMEARFLASGYRNRFRYRLGVSYPFGRESGGERPWAVGASNEIFFTDREPYFERNRLLFHINRRLTPAVSAQVGYLHQFDYRINDETGRDFLVLGFYFDLKREGNAKGGDAPGSNGD
jgi:hypothetical protein